MSSPKEPSKFNNGDRITPGRLNDNIDYMVALRRQIEAGRKPHSVNGGVVPVLFKLGDSVRNHDESGRYDATIYLGDLNPSSDGDLMDSDIGTANVNSPDSEAWNLWEITNGPYGKCLLPKGDFYDGWAYGVDDNGKTLIIFSWPFTGLFPVRLKQSGGAAGSSSGLCSYTYDVYLLDNTTKISTSPVNPKSSPCRAFPMKVNTSAAYGSAFFDNDGSLQLITCNETTGNKNCSTGSGSGSGGG